jgi:hypothetical protein
VGYGATRRHYAKLYGRPGAMHSAFGQFAAFTQDAEDNKAFAASGNGASPSRLTSTVTFGRSIFRPAIRCCVSGYAAQSSARPMGVVRELCG